MAIRLCALLLLLSIFGNNAEEKILRPGRELPFKQSNDLNIGVQLAAPEQIHISYGGDPSVIFVNWLTYNDTGDSFVEWGTDDENLSSKSLATITRWRETVLSPWSYTHRAEITGVVPGQKYWYRVGSEHAYSNIFSFKGLKERSNGGGYRYAVYGDFGLINARSLGRLQNLAQTGDFDVVLHIGDFAYDLPYFGNEFMRSIEPIASRVPYMSIPGNHEFYFNFTQYRNRFSMPNSVENLFYSFDLGDAHIIGITTEIYYSLLDKKNQLQRQYNWLVEDLKKANENRENVPWIIVMGHRPMYCTRSGSIFSDCSDHFPQRDGDFGLEKLFYDNGVDLQLWGHEHNYERLFPVYNQIVYNGTDAPYTNPPAPVHVISGSAGCQETADTFKVPPKSWDAFRSSDYGFSRMQIYNKTHLYWEQVRAYDGVILDSFTLIKDSHGPYTNAHLEQLKKFGSPIPKSN